MTTVEIGRIISIEYEDDLRFVEIDAQTTSLDPQNPTVISAGAKHTVVLISNIDPQNSAGRFWKMDAAFSKGDVVEFYGVDTPGMPNVSPVLVDENDHQLAGVGANPHRVAFRKIRTGSANPSWGAL